MMTARGKNDFDLHSFQDHRKFPRFSPQQRAVEKDVNFKLFKKSCIQSSFDRCDISLKMQINVNLGINMTE